MEEIQTLTIDAMELKHFKGTKHIDIAFDPTGTTIHGDNGSGKTTIVDAWFWAISGKDSAGRADFEIKTKDANGATMPGLNHSAEIHCTVGGKQFSMCKSLSEVWSETRGSKTKEMKGNTTDHYWNDVPLSKGDYESKLKEICDPLWFRLLSDPYCFCAMHWQERRRILTEIAGDVTMADVIACVPELRKLPDVLGNLTTNERLAKINRTQKEINEDLQTLPSRIDEAHRSKPTIDTTIVFDTESLRSKDSELRNKRATAISGGAIAAKNQEIAELTTRMAQIQLEQKRTANDETDNINRAIRSKAADANDCQLKIDRFNRQITEAEGIIAIDQKRIETLRTEWQSIKNREFVYEAPTHTFADVCDKCGQEIAPNIMEKWRNDASNRDELDRLAALEAFNLRNAKDLEENNAQGLRLGAKIKEFTEKIEIAKNEIKINEATKAELDTERIELETKRDSLTTTDEPVENPELKSIETKIATIRSEIERLQVDSRQEVQTIDDEIASITEQLTEANRHATLMKAIETTDARIADLKRLQKSLGEQFEQLESDRKLIERYVVEHIKLLTSSVNARFDYVQFKMFNIQVNGGIEQCCDATFEGVPYESLNTGSKIKVGLDIINALARHRKFAPPVFIDNAESVTSIIKTIGQQIRLVVDDIPTLKVR